MALWQTFKIVGDPKISSIKGCTSLPTIVNKVQNSTQSGSRPTYSDDEKIKWQWAVRCRPDSDCPHSCRPKTKCIKKQGWVAWLFRLKPEEIILDKENCPPKEPEKKPKIWELEYYNYLLPDSYLKEKPSPDSCRLQIMENRRKELNRESLECLNTDPEMYVRNAEKDLAMQNQNEICKKFIQNKSKANEPQPCPPPLPKEPRDIMVKKSQSMGTCSNKKEIVSFDEFDLELPYEDKPLKVTTTHPKQFKFKAKTKTQWKSFPPISEEEVQLLCRLDYKNAQFKYVECPKSMYTRFKNVSQEDGLQPVSCKCTLKPVNKWSKAAEGPCQPKESYWGKSSMNEDMFKCQHPLEKRK